MAAVLLGAAALTIPVIPHLRMEAYSPSGRIGLEAATALTRLFVVLVLFLFVADERAPHLPWIAAGLTVLGIFGLIFGYVEPLVAVRPDTDVLMYESLLAWSVAPLLFLVGLLPEKPPTLSIRRGIAIATILGAAGAVTALLAPHLPAQVRAENFRAAIASAGSIVFPGLTPWHWVLSAIPLLLTAAAAVAAVNRYHSRLDGWLIVGMVLLVMSLVYNLLWPSTFLPVVSTGDLIRLSMGLVVAVGAVLELRRVAVQRRALLTAEREEARRLADLNELRAGFTAMVAHELAAPVAAIQMASEVLALDGLTPHQRLDMLRSIRSETDTLHTLVRDVWTTAQAERYDFAVRPEPIPLAGLLADAATFARTLSGQHPVSLPPSARHMVWADRERAIQLLRNLLSNAAKYSPAGAPIEVSVHPAGSRVRIEVRDHGRGISEGDLQRVFEKFERIPDEEGSRVPGAGLGLYLSRRIARAHASDLTVRSTPGQGSVFGFELEVVL